MKESPIRTIGCSRLAWRHRCEQLASTHLRPTLTQWGSAGSASIRRGRHGATWLGAAVRSRAGGNAATVFNLQIDLLWLPPFCPTSTTSRFSLPPCSGMVSPTVTAPMAIVVIVLLTFG